MKINKTLVSLLILICLWFFAFHKFFVNGLIPLASDIPTGMYYPWLNNSFGFPVKVPVKNPILTDTVSQFWIWRDWAIDNLKSGKISFWNPFSLAGYSMSPWFHTILFSPSNIFYFLFDTTTAIGFIISFQILITLFSFFFLAKKLFRSQLAAIFGSISFAFSSFSIAWMTWGTIGWTIAFLPLVLLFIVRIIEDKTIKPINFLGFYLALFFSFLGGHPQTFLYVLLISFLFFLCLGFKSGFIKNKFIFLLIFSILTIGLTMFVLLPSLPIIFNSIRNQENYIQSNNFGFFDPFQLMILFFAPNFFGNPGTNNYWGENFNFQEKLVWYGSLAFILSIYSLIRIFRKKKKSRIELFLLLTFFSGIFLSLKYPIGFLVYKFKLPFLSTSSASRALLLTIFSGSLLASSSISEFIKSKKGSFASKWSLFIVFSLFVSFLFSLSFSFFYLNKFSPNNLFNLKIGIRNLIIPFLVCFPFVFFLIFNFKNHLLKKFFVLFFIAIATFEGLYFFKKYTPFTSSSLFFPSTSSIKFIEQQYKTGDFFRIEREKAEILPPNMWQQYNFYSASGYDPIFPVSYSNFLINRDIIEDPTRYIELTQSDLNKIPELGIKYFFILKRNNDDRPDTKGDLPEWVNLKQWKPVFEEEAAVILENLQFKAPYFFADQNNKQVSVDIKLIRHTDTDWIFEIQNSDKGHFILFENNDSNWKAKINNKKVNITNFEETFKSVELSPGNNKVHFYYENKLIGLGIGISLISLVLLIIISIFLWRKK